MIGPCDRCGRPQKLHADRGERLCLRCLVDGVDDDLHRDGLAVIEDGRPTTYRPGMAQPRAWHLRSGRPTPTEHKEN